jgi:tetratricopeptide (TPR) repeat protein
VLFEEHDRGWVLQLEGSLENESHRTGGATQTARAAEKAPSEYPVLCGISGAGKLKDEYAYQSLAQLYVDWAKRSSISQAESADYLSRAEAVISEGLRIVPIRDGLWIVSAAIQEVLGNRPEYLQELERAVRSTPTSTLARYLLGRAYRKSGQPQKALLILKPIIESNTDEFRSFVEYANAMHEIGDPYSKAIAVLRLSTLYGFGDPRFVATLSGMLFMNEEFSAAKQVTAESLKREFPAEEAQRIQFRPRDPADRTRYLELSGKVAALKVGYAFIDAPGYDSFFCHASKFGGLLMRPGMNVRFGPAFTARSAEPFPFRAHPGPQRSGAPFLCPTSACCGRRVRGAQ